MKHSFCEDWEFTRHWTEAFGKGLPVPKQEAVRLPHTCREVPLHYATPADYEMVCGYRKRFRVPPVQAAPRLFVRFDGAAHQAVVRVNGRVAGQHRGGYTGFAVEITDLVDREGENLLTVQLDTREDPAIPPFGFVIDYLTYGGLYREVWLEATAESRLTDLFVYTPTLQEAVVQWTAELTPATAAVRIRLETTEGTLLAEQTAPAAETGKMQLSVPEAQPWDTEHPVLHHAVAELLNAAGQPIDRKQMTFGFRTAEFRADGFYLNGKKTFLRGLNRHQSYPYIGYAAPESLQREDARILQEELHCTAVRTSHYPQSQYFLDECDRRGLLVFTELPGWQHIGDDNWKDAACEMLQEMLLQNRNHPSIILWGVRINESVDDDAFYTRTNKIAHQLDPSRATSGVRYLEKSHLLEDVYAYNDFSHNGTTPGVKPKKDVTPDMGTALPHPPFVMDDTIGELLETQEHFSPSKAAAVRDCLLAAGKYGLAGLPLAYKVKFGWCMLRYKMAFKDGVALYGKYVGNWGGEATRWRFDAVQDGNVVRSVTLCPSAKLHLEVKVSRTVLREKDTYDMAAVRVRILDENGTPAPYAQFPVQFAVEGSAALVGPQTAVAEGGMTGTYLRTVGTAGEAALTVSAPQTQPVVLRFTIEKEDAVWN